MRPLVHPIQDGMLRAQRHLMTASAGVCLIQAHLHHVAGAHAPALGHAVYQCLVQIKNQRLLVRPVQRFYVQIGGLSSRNQRPRRRRCPGVSRQGSRGGGRGLELGGDVGNGVALGTGADRLRLAVFTSTFAMQLDADGSPGRGNFFLGLECLGARMAFRRVSPLVPAIELRFRFRR